MNILDLDDISSWDEIYNGFIRNDPYWSVIESALSHETYDEFSIILQGLENRIECVESAELLSLRQRCCEFFKKTYTHVTAYHACRPTNIDSYLRNGIIPANTEELIESAKKLFNDADAVDEAVKDINEDTRIDYLEHGRDNISFFISRTGSLASGYTQYLEYGSELVKSIASRLGEGAVQKLSNQGTPTVFQCAIPVSWLEEFKIDPNADRYALAPLQQLLKLQRPMEGCDDTIKGVIRLTHPVPKELILDAIDMTPFMTEEEAY